MKAITLKAGRDKSALRYHPWIFSGAIDEVVGDPALGDVVEVYSYHSDFLGLAAYSPKSQIRRNPRSVADSGPSGPKVKTSRLTENSLATFWTAPSPPARAVGSTSTTRNVHSAL